MRAETGSVALLEPVLDLLPSPTLLIEPGTARVLYANAAAHRLAGGAFPIAGHVGDYESTYALFDDHDRPLPADEHPAVRAARGEPVRQAVVDWSSPAGRRSISVSADTARLQGVGDFVLLTFDDVTELQTARRRAAQADAEVRAILEGVADAITAQAPDGTLVYANHAAVALVGYDSLEELLAAPVQDVVARFEMLDEDGAPLNVERLPGRRALAGEEPEPLIVRSRSGAEKETRWTRVKAKPVRDADGSVRLAINLIEDITELKRAEQGQRFLAEASRVLSGSLDYQETLATVARLAVPDVADWCGVDVLADGVVRRVAVAHVDPAKRELATEVARRYPVDPESATGVPAVLRTGRAELYPRITDEMLVGGAHDADHLALLRSVGMSSAMIVPMTARATVVGAISFVSAEAGRSYGPGDLELAESLASRAAAAVENSRLYEQRSAIARTLQASLLPPALPELPGFELAALYRAAGEGHDVGGDFYDIFSTAEHHWYAVIGDVCGKGAEAAALTAMARHTIRAAAVRRRSPAAILRLLGEAMARQEDAEGPWGRFCTIACLQVDLSQTPARTTIACAGHPLPVVVRADGRAEEFGVAGTLLGLADRPSIHDAAGTLSAGDTIVLYTDGLTEAGAPEHVWGPDELIAVMEAAPGGSAQALVDHAVAAALGHQAEPRDDIALLALRARP